MNLSSVNDSQKSDKVYLIANQSARSVQPVHQLYRTSAAPSSSIYYLQTTTTTQPHHTLSPAQQIVVQPPPPPPLTQSKVGNNKVCYFRAPSTSSTSLVPTPFSSAGTRIVNNRQPLPYTAVKPNSATLFGQKPVAIDRNNHKIVTTLVSTHTRPNPITTKPTTTVIVPSTSASSSAAAAAAAAVAETNDPLINRYRTILENLLQLKNGLVQRTITEAIKSRGYQTREDLLNVIFKSFELILHSVKVEEIYLNDTCLNATAAFLARVIETGRFVELIENKHETRDIGTYITPEMASILNQVSLASAYKTAREIFQLRQRHSYAKILELLCKMVGCIKLPLTQAMTADEIQFWYTHILPLMFDADSDIQANAIDAVKHAIPLLLASKHHSHPEWAETRQTILQQYTGDMNKLLAHHNAKWYLAWCNLIRLLDIDIPRSATTLNAFLSIVEPALRSSVPARRAEGYLCWRVLLEVLVRHNRLNSEKRLKLMCTPLKSLQAKSVDIAINKFQAWWYVLCNVHDNVSSYIAMVFEPFVQFSFGPITAEPNIRSEPADTPTQVKDFPDVSMMAIVAFIRLLGDGGPQIDDLFAKYSLAKPTHPILNENIFSQSTATIVINACGEATFMLNNLCSHTNNNIDCVSIVRLLWANLFKHVNAVANVQHIDLVLDNIQHLLNIGIADDNRRRSMTTICALIMAEVSASFVFNRHESEPMTQDIIDTTLKYLDILVRLHDIAPLLGEMLAKPLTLPTDPIYFDHNIHTFLTELHQRFFQKAKCSANDRHVTADEFTLNKYTIWSTAFLNVSSFVQSNSNESNNKFYINDFDLFEVYCTYVYWPLSLTLARNEFDEYSKTLLSAIDVAVNEVDRPTFCKQSAKVLNAIVTSSSYCDYINETIATLFEYMVYDFTDIKDAPLDMLNVCTNVIKNTKIARDRLTANKFEFQDFNAIVVALIKFRQSISSEQYSKIAAKMQEVMVVIEQNQSGTRTDPALVKDLSNQLASVSSTSNGDPPKETKTTPNLRSTRKSSAMSSPATSSKVTRSSAAAANDDFVVVDKVWKLDPNKLTEHQREKMKTRRCDIPALYNDLSRSQDTQDTQSIQEWAPKTTRSMQAHADAMKNENSEKNSTKETKVTDENTAINNTLESSVESETTTPAKETKSPQTKTPAKKVTRSSEAEKKNASPGAGIAKRRITRELSRIHIDANAASEVPVENSVPQSNRLTRSTIRQAEEQTDRRKTRSESTRLDTSVNVSTRAKTTRSSLANSPVPTRQAAKAKANSRLSNSAESEPVESTTKRVRVTRQTKSEEIVADSTTSTEKPIDFVDTLKLNVVKLPNDVTDIKSVDEVKKKATKKVIDTEKADTTESASTKIESEPMEVEATENTPTTPPLPPPSESPDSSTVIPAEKEDEKIDTTETQAAKIDVDNKAETAECSQEKMETAEKAEVIGKEETTETAVPEQVEGEKADVEKVETEKTEAETSDAKTAEVTEKIESMETAIKTEQDAPEMMEVQTLRSDDEETDEIPSSQGSNDGEANKSQRNVTANKSYMSALVFDELSPAKQNPNDSILTSPQIDAQRNLEFLNDTLNISPIQADNPPSAEASDEDKEAAKAEEKVEEPKESTDVATNADTETEPVDKNVPKAEVKVNEVMQALNNQPSAASSPVVALTSSRKARGEARAILNDWDQDDTCVSGALPSKQYKTSLSISASTPIQSHHSPVSSKFSSKTQLMGRGAQLLKMINSNKIQKPASPTLAPSNESAATMIASSSPSIKQLQTAPIRDNNVTSTPEQQSRYNDDRSRANDNGEFLTFSSVLPSPYESPGVSILKRKFALNDTDDDSMRSPAPKRKRVSFNFPLSQTKEYIVEEEFTPYYLMPSNSDSPSRDTFGNITSPANRLKNKFKRSKHRSDSLKALNKLSHSFDSSHHHHHHHHHHGKSSRSGDMNSSSSSSKMRRMSDLEVEDEVSVKHIKEYLEMNTKSHREQNISEKTDEYDDDVASDVADDGTDDEDDEMMGTNPAVAATHPDDAANSNSDDDSSTESNVDDTEIVATATEKPVATPTLDSFTETEILDHLLAKYSANDYRRRAPDEMDEKTIRLLTSVLSMQMTSDKLTENLVLAEMAEQHSAAFLDHTITENICSVICDRLSAKPSSGFVDYITEKMNNDETFANAVLSRVPQKLLQKPVFDAVAKETATEKQKLFEELLAKLETSENGDSGDDHHETIDVNTEISAVVYRWITKQFSQYRLTSDQFEELTDIYITKKKKMKK